MKKLVFATGLIIAMGTTAIAGNASWTTADGTKMRINCASSCKVTAKAPGAKKWTVVEKTKASTKNFNELKAKYGQ